MKVLDCVHTIDFSTTRICKENPSSHRRIVVRNWSMCGELARILADLIIGDHLFLWSKKALDGVRTISVRAKFARRIPLDNKGFHCERQHFMEWLGCAMGVTPKNSCWYAGSKSVIYSQRPYVVVITVTMKVQLFCVGSPSYRGGSMRWSCMLHY